MPRVQAWLLVPMLHFGLASCATNSVTGNPAFVTVTESQELRMGRQGDQQIKSRYALHDSHGAERASVKPLRLKLTIADADTRIAHLARRSPLGPHAEGYLRLMNGLYPAGEPVRGETLKIVE